VSPSRCRRKSATLSRFAESERKTMIDRVAKSMATKASEGKWSGGKRPTATRSTAKHRNWCHTPEESPHLREIFRLYTEARLGTCASADELNRRGVPSRTGAPWSEYSVSRVIANPVYAGDIAYGDVHAENATSRSSTGRPGGKPAPSRPPAPITTASAPSARAITTSLG
jgi:site-specific DNA recombinase